MHHLSWDGKNKAPAGAHVQAQQTYYDMRRRHDIAKRTATEAYRAMREAEGKLIEAMMDIGVSKLDYMDDGSSINFFGGLSVSVTEKNEGEVREWLRESYGDDAPFEKVSMDKKEITSRIREDIKSGALSETDVPDAMNLKQFPGIRVNGWKEV